jgi:hypothetical protein
MTAIITSLLGGGWPLVAGWILPAALNTAAFAFLVLPALGSVRVFHVILVASHPIQSLLVLSAAVIGGLVLSALSTPLYRILEGYSWPAPARRRRIARAQRSRRLLEKRLQLARLTRRSRSATLGEPDTAELGRLRDDPSMQKTPEFRRNLTALEISLLAEKLRRYPVDSEQILPTRLGNAIRRFEEYGYDRYRLDIITMWDALYGVADDQLRRQVDAGRAGVDFYVCLIYGHLVVALAAIGALSVGPRHVAGPIAALIGAVLLSAVWYRLAINGTDEWAAAVRGLTDLGRKPLAEALGLVFPPSLEQERRMWELVSRQSRRPHSHHDSDLDPFRAAGSSP